MTNFKKCLLAGVLGLLSWPAALLAVVPYQDNNRPLARPADDFEYSDTTSGPLQNGWGHKGWNRIGGLFHLQLVQG